MLKNKNNADAFNSWYLTGSIVVSLVVAAVGYSIQFIIYPDYFLSVNPAIPYLFRAIRMLLGYVIVPIIFLQTTEIALSELGFNNTGGKELLLAFFGGVLIYLVPGYIFVKFHIFTSEWYGYDLWQSLFYLSLIGLMAGITDFWTRGYILLMLNRKYGATVAIIGQNLLWFGIHMYEILLISPYIGLVSAITLTLFLGITGDLLTLHTRNISGLIVGHVILNLLIMLGGQGLISW